MEIPTQKSGKVIMQDGSPLPEPAEILLFCGRGIGRPIAKTDSKGGFVLGSGLAGESDARSPWRIRSAPGGALAGNLNMPGCTLQARIPGFQSGSLQLAGDDAFDIGVIVLSRRAGVEGSTVSATGLYAPIDARQAFEKGKQAMAKNKPDQARPLLEKAVKSCPEHAPAWLELGKVFQSSNDLPQAKNAYEQAIKADPKFITPYLHLAVIQYAEKNWKATAETTATIIKLDPFDYPAAYAFNAKSNFRLGNATAAKIAAEKAQEIDPAAVPEMEYILGTIMAERGDIKGATEHLNNYLKLAPNAPGVDIVKKQLAEYEKAGTLK